MVTRIGSDKNCTYGFTLIELLVVLAIMATLSAIVAPRYFASIDKAKEAALRSDLRILRESIDKYRADTGKYPTSLNTLVVERYIYSIPPDPFTDSSATWKITEPPDSTTSGVFDVHSGASALGTNGVPYQKW